MGNECHREHCNTPQGHLQRDVPVLCKNYRYVQKQNIGSSDENNKKCVRCNYSSVIYTRTAVIKVLFLVPGLELFSKPVLVTVKQRGEIRHFRGKYLLYR
jgi:hypothetical protein